MHKTITTRISSAKIVPWLVILLGIGCVIAGVFRGEARTMFEKAVNICLECIGIG